MGTEVSHGARWVRAALQVNPYSYQGRNAPSTKFANEADYNKALLDECDAQGIELLAVTDHWCIDTGVGLIHDATQRGIVALPGFEANSEEGYHLLIIFSEDTDVSIVNAAIGRCGAQPGCSNGTTGQPFTTILEEMTAQGALVIPAHVNVPNSGLLTGRTGQPLIEKIKHTNLHALAVSPSHPEGHDQSKIFNRTAPYDRPQPIAKIHADDVMMPDTLKTDGASSWFKMSSPCVESLKLAIRTPETRVALINPRNHSRAALKQISWTGGFLDGVTIPFSSDLTTFIGGRGTGKSTAIESLRFVLDLKPIGVKASNDHDAVIENVLRTATEVQLVVETTDPIPRNYTIKRCVGQPPQVLDENGMKCSLTPSDILKNVEVFGQHEIAELTDDGSEMAKMLRRFQGDGGKPTDRTTLLRDLQTNRESLEQAEHELHQIEMELEEIPRLEELIQQYTKTKIPDRLREVTRLDQYEAAFNEADQRVRTARKLWSDRPIPNISDDLIASDEDNNGSPHEVHLEKARTAIRDLAEKLDDLRNQEERALRDASSEVRAAKSNWEDTVGSQRQEHQETLRRLTEEGLEPGKYLDTKQSLETYRAKEPLRDAAKQRINSLLDERVKLLEELRDHEAEQDRRLKDAVQAANLATDGVVNVRPVPNPNRQHLQNLIADAIHGHRTQITDAIDRPDFSVRKFVEAARAGVDALDAQFSIKAKQAEKLRSAGESLFRQFEEQSVGQAVEVRLDVQPSASSRDYKPITELSKGQRATAILLLLLGASTDPLVIDQPEDDLDNRFVYEGIVTNLRRLKGQRQIIASTHNANVPVLGDAELIVTLDGDGRRGRTVPDGVGSLDSPGIRSHVESILEGGPAAFNARRHLYGF